MSTRKSGWVQGKALLLVALLLFSVFSVGVGYGLTLNGTWSGDWFTEKYGNFTSGLKDEALTSGRIVIAGSQGLLGDDADLTFVGGDTLNVANVSTSELYINGENRTDAVLYPYSEASYIVGVDGSTYYAKNGTTGAIDYSGADAATVIQAAINAYKDVFLKEGTFTLTSQLYPLDYTHLHGSGMGTILVMLTNTNMINIHDVSDVEIDHLQFKVTNATRTASIININPDTEHIYQINIHDCWLYDSTKDALITTGAYPGIWIHPAANYGLMSSWFTTIRFSNIKNPIYVSGPNLSFVTSCTFSKLIFWSFVTALNVGDSAGDFNGNTINDCEFIHLATGEGAVTGCWIRGFWNTFSGNNFWKDAAPAFIAYNFLAPTAGFNDGSYNQVTGGHIELATITDDGRKNNIQITDLNDQSNTLNIPTVAGWTAVVTDSGATTQSISYNMVKTGTTVDSTARLYTTDLIFGFRDIMFVDLDYDDKMTLTFDYTRSTSEVNATARVQLKGVTTEGALAGKGVGIKVVNLALYGESYGASGADVDLSTNLTADNVYQIKIIIYPGVRIEWWVNGVLKNSQTTAAKIPTGGVTTYLVHSITTVTSNPSADAQSYLFRPQLWQEK